MPELSVLIEVRLDPRRARLIIDDFSAAPVHRVVQGITTRHQTHCSARALAPVLAVFLFEHPGRAKVMLVSEDLVGVRLLGKALVEKGEPPDLSRRRSLRQAQAYLSLADPHVGKDVGVAA